MKTLLDSFWRAAAYCLHPRVIGLSLLPLLIAGGLAAVLGWFFWEPAVDAVRAAFDQWELTRAFNAWLVHIGAGAFRVVYPLLVVVGLAVPVVVTLSLLLVATMMTPALTRMVAVRRFPMLQKRHGGSWWETAAWAMVCTVAALFALALSIPLWLIPPLIMILPPLIWGWLTYEVMTFDVLSSFATRDERRRLMRQERWHLLGIGVVAGYLGAAPALIWSMGVMTIVYAPWLIVVSVWLYTLVFAFSSLWFAHFALAALHRMRLAEAAVDLPVEPPSPPPTGFDLPLPPEF